MASMYILFNCMASMTILFNCMFTLPVKSIRVKTRVCGAGLEFAAWDSFMRVPKVRVRIRVWVRLT